MGFGGCVAYLQRDNQWLRHSLSFKSLVERGALKTLQ
jgi:hypothetical protein